VGELTREPLLRELPYNPTEIQRGLVSCTGTDFCNLALIDTKDRGRSRSAREFESRIEARAHSRCAGRAAPVPAVTTTRPTWACKGAR